MSLLEILQNRRSVRSYTGEPVADEKIEEILKAGLLSASSKGKRPWEFIVVRDKESLKVLSQCRTGSAKMLENADCAIIVIADGEKTDVWIEDCSITMSNMHLMADSLAVGSCWIQGRCREASDGSTTESYVRELLGFPETYRLEAILSLGIPEKHPKPISLDELPDDKIHRERYAVK